MKRATILFQPPNHIGLGHISRLLAIALAVREQRADLLLPFVVEGHGHGLIEAHRFPHLSAVGTYDFYETPHWSGWEPRRRHLMMLELASAQIRALAPDLIVFDCFPHTGIATAAIEQRIPIAICLRQAKNMNVYFQPLKALWSSVHRILIPHDPGTCDVPAELLPRTRFTGPIVRPRPPQPASPDPSARRTPGAAAAPVIITGGGGGYAGTVDFYNLACRAFALARRQQPSLQGTLVAGPLFSDWSRLDLVEGLRVVPFDPDLSGTFASAGLVICQAGYNTVSELLSLGVPALCVPAERGYDDQFERARRSADASALFRMYAGADPQACADLMLTLLQVDRRPPQVADTARGARIAADSLIELLPASHAAA